MNLDPKNVAARDGLHRIEQSGGDGSITAGGTAAAAAVGEAVTPAAGGAVASSAAGLPLETSYDLEMEDGDLGSDEAELEESETEAVWSDGDLNLAGAGGGNPGSGFV